VPSAAASVEKPLLDPTSFSGSFDLIHLAAG
jgi:hypothetical protein